MQKNHFYRKRRHKSRRVQESRMNCKAKLTHAVFVLECNNHVSCYDKKVRYGATEFRGLFFCRIIDSKRSGDDLVLALMRYCICGEGKPRVSPEQTKNTKKIRYCFGSAHGCNFLRN